MEKISIFIVFILSLFIRDASCLLCSYNKYYKKGTGCVMCPPCDRGSEFTNNCGYNEAGERTIDAQCRKCIPGDTFKDKKSSDSCDSCQLCMNGKIMKEECTITSNRVCECPQGTYEYYGVCEKVPTTEAPTTTPLTTPSITTTARTVTTPNITTTIQVSSPTEEPRDDKTVMQVKRQADGPFPQTGWIVFFCLLGFLIVVAFIFVLFHKRTRKQISGFCCRKYRTLWPDQEHQREVSSDLMTAEDHYAEHVTNTENHATPIPPWDEPVPTAVQWPSTTEQVYCSCTTKDMDGEKMQCACTQTASDPALVKMTHSSFSSETISEEQQYYSQGKKQSGRTPTRKTSSPSHSTSSGVSSSQSPDLSPCVTPTHLRGLSPDYLCVTASSSSSSPGTTPRGRSPEHHRVASSSPSTCGIPPPPREVSPKNCFVTSSASSSPGVTPRQLSPDLCVTSSSSSTCMTPFRGRSPDIPSIQIPFFDQQEISKQSNECSEIPVSIEACDKKHDVLMTPAGINSSPPARKKRSNSQPTGKRKSPSPTKDLLYVCQHELYLKARCKDPMDKEKDVHSVTTNTDAELHVGIDDKIDENEDVKMKATVAVNYRSPCKFRPIKRDDDIEHRCTACSPQPSDLIFQLINRERLCLKEAICKELDRSYKDLAIIGRVESEMKEYEASLNPAERVLERLKDLHPSMKLKEFEQILIHIKRLDIVDIIHNHHLSCTLCRKNKFDSKA